jgi:lipopolysaccharide/colanic/teichoic acid biosynthesis glycosyltransferase
MFLVMLSPFLLLVSLMVLVFDGWPILFLQERYGQDGKPFHIVKFRTMFRRAPELHSKLQERKSQENHLFKLSDDPRVTRLGRFLRRWFLDELPQLWNIAKGDMRFVGPRPLPASDQSHYTHSCYQLRLNGKPGLTGLWQVSGRNERTFDEMCLLDVYYLRNHSFSLDLLILWRTVAVPFL